MPFELGRPLGIPNDPAFQSRVLLACLRLLEEKKGPVLADFDEEVPAAPTGQDLGTACPISFGDPETGATAAPAEALREEIVHLRPWYDLALKKNGRTTVGVSGIALPDLADFLGAFLDGVPANPREDVALAETLKLAVDDLKAFYTEAMAAQPGLPADSSLLNRWFWEQTAAARLLYALRDQCLQSRDEMMVVLGKMLLIPMRPEA